MRDDTVHLVDEHGLVWCPRQQRDVEAATCLRCAELLVGVRDDDGELREIRCHAPARHVAHPWDLLRPDTLVRG